MKKEISLPKNLRDPAIKYSLKEAGTTGTSSTIGELYAVPFAKEIGAQPLQIGALTAFSGVVAPLAELYGAHPLQHGNNRKKIVLSFAFFQALLWIPLILLAIAVYRGYFVDTSVTIFIVLYTLVVALGNISFPAWFSWIGDLIPQKERGTYWSTRNRIIGIASLIVVLSGAFVLDYFKTRGYLLLGFGLLFACAATFRFFSLVALKRQYVPPFTSTPRDHISLLSFIKRGDNVSKFSVYLAVLNATLMIASPFFALYMLQELKFNYVTLMLVTLSSTIVYLLAMPLMGKYSDRYGNRRLLQIANVGFIFSPLPWIFLSTPLLLIIIPQLFAGVANAALTMGATNFIYDAVLPRPRPRCAAYTGILVGIGTFLGALIGGLILEQYHPSNLNSYFFLFSLAALLRLLVAFFYLPKIQEVKPVARFPTLDLNILHPVTTVHHDLAWIKKVVSTA